MCSHLKHYCHVLYASKTSHYPKIKPINFLFPPYLFIALPWPFLKLQLSCSCAIGTESSSLSSCLECFFSQQNSIECLENNGNICFPHFLSSYTILEMIRNLNNDLQQFLTEYMSTPLGSTIKKNKQIKKLSINIKR